MRACYTTITITTTMTTTLRRRKLAESENRNHSFVSLNSLLNAHYSLHITDYSLFTTHYVIHYLIITNPFSCSGTCACVANSTRRWWRDACGCRYMESSMVQLSNCSRQGEAPMNTLAYYSLRTTHSALLTTHYAPFTTDYSRAHAAPCGIFLLIPHPF